VAVAFLLLFIIFEYLRLHEILPILGTLRVQTVTFATLILIVFVETAKRGIDLSQQSWLLLGFLGLTFFTIVPAVNQFFAYQFSFGLTLILIGYFAITHVLRNQRDLKGFLSLLVAIHMYHAVNGVRGYSGQFDRYGFVSTGEPGGSFLGDENDLALAMVVILPFGLYLLRQSRSLPARIFWGVGSVMMLLSVVFTFSRGGFVGLGGMFLYWVVTSRNRAKAIGTLVVAAALMIAVAPAGYWARIETIQHTDSGTAQVRWNSWAAARQMFYDSPIWGVGGNNFGVLLPDYAMEYPEERRPTQWGRVAHSLYFELLAEFGLLGVLMIGSVILLNFRDIKKVMFLSQQGRCSASLLELAESLRLSLVGFLVPAAFLSVLTYPHLYYLTGLTVVVCRLAFIESADLRPDLVGSRERTG